MSHTLQKVCTTVHQIAPPVPTPTAAFGIMQARLVALLLRYDEQRFHRLITTDDQRAAERDAAFLQPYRELGTLFVLRDLLFDDLLPRIVRRLSFAAPREMTLEEPPVRGRIDWGRTLEASWNDRPGEAPLQLYTHQRRRDFATPENLLTVVTLLQYQAEAQRLLHDGDLVTRADALRHPLNEIVEQCRRELAFPQFHGMRNRAQAIIEGADGGPESLEQQVAERLIPGGNSAYQDLLEWRRRLQTLHLLRRDAPPESEALGAHPERDSYLYQIWIFYELADLLSELNRLDQLNLNSGHMALRFRWGDDAMMCRYELRHDQGVPELPALWTTQPAQHYAVPGVRPDFYLRRSDPPMVRLEHGGELIWREPGLLWDAKYYRDPEQGVAPSSPIKRMIADLSLLGEEHGTLLFAFLTGGGSESSGYQLTPANRNQSLVPGQPELLIQPLCPVQETQRVRATLSSLLDTAHGRLRIPRTPRCQGVFLDTLSSGEPGRLVGRDGKVLQGGDLLICPKPHIGPWRVDLVSRTEHCCRDGRLCHAIGQPDLLPPLRPPRTAHELLAELARLTVEGDLDTLDEELVERLLSQVEGLTRHFARLNGALQSLGPYEAKLGDIGLDRTLHLLGATERESLALAIYLRDQLDQVQANDYSAAIIHVARVVERELQQRILAIPGISRSDFPHSRPTLGSLSGVRRRNPSLWSRIDTHLEQVWVSQVLADEPNVRVSALQFIDEMNQLVRMRNEAAHTTPISRDRFRTMLRLICGSGGPLQIGALNVLLLAWPRPTDAEGGLGAVTQSGVRRATPAA